MFLKLSLFLAALTLCFQCVFAADSTKAVLPNVFCADPRALADAKMRFGTNDPSLKPAFDSLLDDAKKALKINPPSVTEKKETPPSGDKHDYMSQAPYYWRDTNSPDGKYVREDGERNPESKRDSDAGRLGSVCSGVHTLALAFYFTGDEKYASKAAEILRVFFLNPETKMNPNLNFGQGIPGEADGRPTGLISARGFVDLTDALGLLAASKSWTDADQQGMLAWMNQYFDWLTTSKIGVGEFNAKNNHGSFYDTQAAAIALFIGKNHFARAIILEAETNRIARQIESSGRQPLELERTLSFNYSLFNLRALCDLAALGRNFGIDLWHYRAPNGGSIFRAFLMMSQYADPKVKWPFPQIHEAKRGGLAELLLRAAPQYPTTPLAGSLKFFHGDQLAASRSRLLFKTAAFDIKANPSPPKDNTSPDEPPEE